MLDKFQKRLYVTIDEKNIAEVKYCITDERLEANKFIQLL